jgi:hypothetical protein
MMVSMLQGQPFLCTLKRDYLSSDSLCRLTGAGINLILECMDVRLFCVCRKAFLYIKMLRRTKKGVFDDGDDSC